MRNERTLKDQRLVTSVSRAVADVVAQLASEEGKTVAHWIRDAITEKAAMKPWENFETRGGDE